MSKDSRSVKHNFDFTNMPYYVVVTTEGSAEVEGFLNLIANLISSPEWRVGSNQIVDHRSLDLSGLKYEHIEMIKYYVSCFMKKLGYGKQAFVTNGISSFLAGIYYSEVTFPYDCDTRVFSTVQEAREWILS
jgi:hypothetical protein